MKAILVFIDGTICDTRPRHILNGTPGFYRREEILEDLPVPGSVKCLRELAQQYQIIYLGARPGFTLDYTQEWLQKSGFPAGPLYLAETQVERLDLARRIRSEFDFIAGIGDRWDDNQLHMEIGCMSIILREFEGEWGALTERIGRRHRMQIIKENEIHLRGKVEGLARVCPLLYKEYGERLWQVYFEAVLDMAEKTRDERAKEDLESFARFGLNPGDLRDAAKWVELTRGEGWQESRAYGLQDFETVEASERRYVHKVTRCLYADLWKGHDLAEFGYQIHCHTDQAWWDRPAWNPKVRFKQPMTIMQGDAYCLFIQYLPDDDEGARIKISPN